MYHVGIVKLGVATLEGIGSKCLDSYLELTSLLEDSTVDAAPHVAWYRPCFKLAGSWLLAHPNWLVMAVSNHNMKATAHSSVHCWQAVHRPTVSKGLQRTVACTVILQFCDIQLAVAGQCSLCKSIQVAMLQL